MLRTAWEIFKSGFTDALDHYDRVNAYTPPPGPWLIGKFWPYREVTMLSDGRFVYQDGSPAIHARRP